MKRLLSQALRAAILFLLPIASFAQAPVLGTAAKFVLFTTNGAMTCSGTKYLNHLTGDVGSNLPGSVTGFGNVDGVMHVFDVATGAAAADVVSLYTQLGATIPTGTLASPFGGGLILAPGVYSIPTAATLSGDLILDAAGDPNAIFIFQIGGVLSTSASSKVKLLNGAMACNVFWQVGGAVNVGTGTFLRGTIVADGQIDLTSTLDTLEGRALAMNAPVLVSQLVSYTPIGCGSPYLTGPAAPALVSTATYGVFSSIGAVTSTPVTYVIGDVGANSTTPTGFNPLNVTGTIHAMDPSTAAAAGDLTNVYNYLVAMPADINLLDPANLGHDLVLTPHAYQITGITQLTGNLILNAEGNPNAVFVIKINGGFTTGSLARIILTNGTQAKNVYWKVDGAVNVFSNSVFNGTLVVAGAITLNTGDTLNGRAMTINGAIAINGSYVNTTPAACIAPPIMGMQPTCTGSTTTLSDADAGGTWTSSNTLVATIGSSSGVVTGMTPGTTTINYTSPLSCISTTTLTVGTAPLPITGPNTVCEGSTITLSDATPGGTWSSSNTAQATAGSTTGNITGVASGTPTISYTVPGGCFATQTVTVTPAGPGIITGASTVCVGSSIVLTDTTFGGVWSSSNTNVTVTSGIVTGLATGTSTISYTISTLCGAGTATKTVTVGSTLSAGVITGPSNVCVGSSVSLTDATPSGIWSSSNARATVISGLVTGVSAGSVTISYTVASSCGTASATKSMTVSTLPIVGVITGPSSVCVASTIALTDLITGGTWSVSNTNATVSGGTVTGVASGTSTITYTVTNSCGSTIAIKSITVNPLPNAGTITGASVVCVGSTTALTDATTGGVWSSSNTNATVTGGLVTGVATGTATISYSVTNVCGTANALHSMTVNTIPGAGVITGPSIVCQGATIAMTDATTGGIWSSSNTNATVTGGLVTGVSSGTATISYTVTNTCGTVNAVKSITVNPLPVAGTITGASSVCVGSSISLTDAATGGIWSSSNTNATVISGVVTGVVSGTATISYTVTNTCGTANAVKSITVNPLPVAGTITGASSVCVGSSISLTDAAAGGIWSSSNTNATVISGVVTGVASGTADISYTVTNSCGTANAVKSITVNPLPVAGTITGASSVCAGSSITLTDAATGGIWSSSNTNATVISGVVTGVAGGTADISYTVTNTCGTANAVKSITVNPLPNPGVITGITSVCVGSVTTLTNTITGGIWTSGSANATVISGKVTGVSAGIATISYAVTNTCGTATTTQPITVIALPALPVMSTQSPASVCLGTMYQNFGTATAPPANTYYTWSATNATVWAQGTGHQYALINFTTAGTATVILSATKTGSACSSKSSTTVTVSSSVSHTPQVRYFNNHFVCTPSNEGTYQWGYDDIHSLDSTLLAGEINQDYLIMTPDFANKAYWAMTTSGGCMQKTYYKVPNAVQNINGDANSVSLYPNPATNVINVVVNTPVSSNIQVEVLNMMGQKTSMTQTVDNKATIDIATLPAGYYMVACYQDGARIATAKFIKN